MSALAIDYAGVRARLGMPMTKPRVRLDLIRSEPAEEKPEPKAHPARDRMQDLIGRVRDEGKAHSPIRFESVATDDPTMPRWMRIALECCYAGGITLSQLRSQSRSRHIIKVRHEVMWRLVMETDMSLSSIGRRLRRDHTTVIHGARKHAVLHGLHNPCPYQEVDCYGRAAKSPPPQSRLPKPDLSAWMNLGGNDA